MMGILTDKMLVLEGQPARSLASRCTRDGYGHARCWKRSSAVAESGTDRTED